ncbi:TIGR02444 family protein [Pelagibacterium mangrovi]|uniref:TIGR02444 family protein n=1 Tax=Pelagibacterium mangrovi TaxID=3119828 RepID=UPI002FC76D2B
MTEPAALEAPHWRFAVDLYARDGVSQACLALQDRFGVDVIVLMAALYGAVALGKAPGADDIERMDAAIVQWRHAVVHPLREVRRYLKMADMGEAAERLREIVKSSELRSEQIELALLAPLAKSFSGQVSPNRLQMLDLLALVTRFFAQDEVDRHTLDHIVSPIVSAAMTLGH